MTDEIAVVSNALPAHLMDFDPAAGTEEAEALLRMPSYRIIQSKATCVTKGEENYIPEAEPGGFVELVGNTFAPYLNAIVVSIVSGYEVMGTTKDTEKFFGGFVRKTNPVLEGSAEGKRFDQRVLATKPNMETPLEGFPVAHEATLLVCLDPVKGTPFSVLVRSYSNKVVKGYVGQLAISGEPACARLTNIGTERFETDYGVNYKLHMKRMEEVINEQQAQQVKDLLAVLATEEGFQAFARFYFPKESADSTESIVEAQLG